MKDTILKITKSKDDEDRESLTIEIDDKAAFIPTSIVSDFLSEKSKTIQVTIPY